MQFRVFLMATLLYNSVSAPPTQLITQKETFKYRLNSTSALPVCFKAKKSWTNYCTPSIPWLMPLSCLRHRGDLLSHFWHFGIYSEWFFFTVHLGNSFRCETQLLPGLSEMFFNAASPEFHLWSTCHCLVVGRVLLLMGKRGPNVIEWDWHRTPSHLRVIYSF